MAVITVVDSSGNECEIQAEPGQKLMEILRELDGGVAAICGGMCSCATCHVYVDQASVEGLEQPDADERELLAALSHVTPQSRLSCQIEFTEALSGLRVIIAPAE